MRREDEVPPVCRSRGLRGLFGGALIVGVLPIDRWHVSKCGVEPAGVVSVDPGEHRSTGVVTVVEFTTLTYVEWFSNGRLRGGITTGPGYTTPANYEADYYRQNVPTEPVRTQTPESL
jgi:hypothetical protein